MGKRWKTDTRLWAYRYLVTRDGEVCQRCSKIPTTRNSLGIDHIDGNPKNNHPDNLRLLCRSCNQSEENHRRSMCGSVCERKKIEGQSATRIVKEDANYRHGTPEMQANLLYEIAYRRWLLEQINAHSAIAKQEAINSGAELVGCSPVTTRKYLDKLTSHAGVLKEEKDILGHTYLSLKPKFEKSIYPDLQPIAIADLIKYAQMVKARVNGNGHRQ